MKITELLNESQQGVVEGSLEEVDRRGFLKGFGAMCASGTAGCGIVENVREGKKRFLKIKIGMTKSDVWKIMGGKELGLGPKQIKGSTGPWGDSETWEFNGVGTIKFLDGKVYIIDYVDSPLNNYNESINQDIAEEQLAELSPKTLASYKKKAGAQASELDKRAFHKDTEPKQAKQDIAKANKRFSGIVRATKKEFGK